MLKLSRRNPILIDGDLRASVSMVKSRLSILSACFIIAYMIVTLSLINLTIVQGEVTADGKSVKTADSHEIKALNVRRGDVYDRNGFLIATTLNTPSLYVDPSLVLNPNNLTSNLQKIIPDLNAKKALATMEAKNRFGWIAHNITPKQQQKVLSLGDPSLNFKYEYKRVYPQEKLFAHLVGYTNRDGLGLSGVERSYDDILSSGKDVHLTLDLRLQHLVKRELSRAISDFTAIAGTGIIMDAKTGEVLAGVSLPDFDLNLAGQAPDNQKFNRLTLGVYELGSMFKIFSTAALLELKKVGFDKTFDARKPIKVGWYTIHDYHAQKRKLTIPEIFMYSSNIGSALMGKMVGEDALKAFYDDLGLMDSLRFDIKEIGAPIIPNPWRPSTTMTVSYGHGIATSPMQMVAAVASVINGGMAVRPVLVLPENAGVIKNEVQILSKKTSENMRKLLRLVVTEGTGRNADVKGYAIGGKTGTAEKSINGKYSSDHLISSFVGVFPIDDPKYVVMVMVDEPHGNKSSYGYATAGWVAAPAVKRIVTSMAGVLGMPADKYDSDKDIAASLMPYLHDPKYKKRNMRAKLVSY